MDEKQALRFIVELTELIAEKASPLWAWYAIHEFACQALHPNKRSEKSIQWAINMAEKLDLIPTSTRRPT